jgi:hypothetical protein
MAVVGGDQRQVHGARELYKPRQRLLFLREAVILKLNVEIPLAEDGDILFHHLLCVVLPPVQKELRDVARQARRQRDQPAGIF